MAKTGHTGKRETRMTRRKREQRRLIVVLILIVLIIFGLGTIFGCFIQSALTPNKVNAAEETTEVTPKLTIIDKTEYATEHETLPDSTLYDLKFESGQRVLDRELQEAMIEMCEKYNVPFALALAVAEQESRFNPNAVSSTNDHGIMQINECNFGWLRKQGIEPLEYRGNIEAGILILSKAIEKHTDYERALMAYNCGDAGAKRLWDKGIYNSEYSRSTMERYNKWNAYIGGV